MSSVWEVITPGVLGNTIALWALRVEEPPTGAAEDGVAIPFIFGITTLGLQAYGSRSGLAVGAMTWLAEVTMALSLSSSIVAEDCGKVKS